MEYFISHKLSIIHFGKNFLLNTGLRHFFVTFNNLCSSKKQIHQRIRNLMMISYLMDSD